jgi:hypothetical protein
VLARGISLELEPAADWDQFSIKDMARPKAEADLIRVLFKLSADQWLSVADAAKRGGANPVWVGVAETMAKRLIPAGKSPSEKQAKILRKALVRYSGIPVIRPVLSEEDLKVLAG